MPYLSNVSFSTQDAVTTAISPIVPTFGLISCYNRTISAPLLVSLQSPNSENKMAVTVCFDVMGTCFSLDVLVEAVDNLLGKDLRGAGSGPRAVVLDWVGQDTSSRFLVIFVKGIFASWTILKRIRVLGSSDH